MYLKSIAQIKKKHESTNVLEAQNYFPPLVLSEGNLLSFGRYLMIPLISDR
jgi:hypothetical protein